MVRWINSRMDIVRWILGGWVGVGIKRDVEMDGLVVGFINGCIGEGKKVMIGYMEGICINRWVCIIYVLIDRRIWDYVCMNVKIGD